MVLKQKLRLTTIVYWVLLLYIIAALVWWAFSLLQQNREIHALQKKTLNTSSISYTADIQQIEAAEHRGVYKYIGEGSAFLLLICVGAAFIFRSVRQQFRLQQQQQNFVMAVTHELKTPIAVARLNLETMQRHQLDESKRTKLLQTTLQETLRLDTLINNILIASQLEDHIYRITKTEVDLSSLTEAVSKSFHSRYPDRAFLASVQPDIIITGDETLLKLLISNLLENANKYSPKNKNVSIQLWQKDRSVFLEVIDEGIGIADEEKKEVFKKFYRVGAEETRKTKGTGLGLFICKKIADDHGAKISVSNNQPLGSKFTVQFYAAND